MDELVADVNNFNKANQNLFMHLYFDRVSEKIINGVSRIVSSRGKDEELFRWRYACNQAKIFEHLTKKESLLLMEEALKTAQDDAEKGKLLAKISILSAEYRAEEFQIAETLKENQSIEQYDIDFSDLNLSFEEAFKAIQGLDEKEKQFFNINYLRALKEFGLILPKTKPSQMGE